MGVTNWYKARFFLDVKRGTKKIIFDRTIRKSVTTNFISSVLRTYELIVLIVPLKNLLRPDFRVVPEVAS